MKKLFIALIMSLFFSNLQAQERQSLAGSWQFKLDENDTGITENWQSQKLQNVIQLPGTTDEAKYGLKTTGSDFGILTRAYKYYGPAWYQKEINIPKTWEGKRISLELERVMWQSKVYVDNKLISIADALSSPHYHDLGYLSAGNHTLTIRVDNNLIYNIGDKGHVYTEYTQSIWNGMVGRIELVAKEAVRFSNPQVYTTISPKTMQIKDTLINESGKKQTVEINYSLTDRKTKERIFEVTEKIQLAKGKTVLDYTADMPKALKLWDDVNPNLYNLEISITNKNKAYDTFHEEIGFREVTTSKSKILINGKPVFFRGNLDCVHFPLTGYPSCDAEEWERIFNIYKDYGLNHVRFHSWCPPKAAFVAADRVGIYLQPETIWLDWWMAANQPGREEMWTKGNPDGLGKNPSADQYVQKELRRMLNSYGNHASFTMQCIGNELGNSDFDVMESWMIPLRESDSRRLYSVSSARKVMPVDQFMATHYLPGIGGTRGIKGGASTNWDFEETYSQSDIPVLAHEIGQWPVYPKWSEIKKYKGTLKARNFEEFREQARKNRIENQNEAFVQASGALNQLMYKYEIESFLRTPSCAGIQLLSMQDYQGQGEALIGWLDAFYDSKGITTPEKVRLHQDTTVTLLRMPKYVWQNNEDFTAEMQLAHYGTTDLNDALYWTIKDELDNVIGKGKTSNKTFAIGSSDIVGDIKQSLSSITTAQKLVVEVGLEKEPVENRWNIWVYPAKKETSKSEVYLANRMNNETIKRLEKGEKVLLQASELGTEITSDKIAFYPLYWSLTFFPGQGRNTIGMVVQDKHPLYASFPTDSHSDWQWQAIYKDARAFYINDYPESYKPIAQPVDDFHRNNKLASIFELKVGKGKLLVTGFDLQDDENPVARQLKASILDYMNSDKFNPQHEVAVSKLQTMFTYVEPLKGVVSQEFENPMLYIRCAANATQTENKTWNINLDELNILKKSSHQANIEGVYKSENATAWTGRKIDFKIDCPSGIIGTLYVCFIDEAGKGYSGDITFEGRSFKLTKITDKKAWVKIHIMREDSNDGMLKFAAKALGNADLYISEVAIVEE